MNANGWIKVSDTLPEKEGMVLIYEDGECYVSQYYTKIRKRNSITITKHFFRDVQDDQDYCYNPTHWQPLPNPPEDDN